MICIIQIKDATLATRLSNLVVDYIVEHNNYYARHGFECAVITTRTMLNFEHCTRAGYNSQKNWEGWVTSNNNAVFWNKSLGLLFIDSKRHGLPFGIDEVFLGYDWIPEEKIFVHESGDEMAAKVIVYITQCPSSSPFSRGLIPENHEN